ncbi:MAG: vitamin B12-dependent ribonucleotide reductase [Bacillota bacterium]
MAYGRLAAEGQVKATWDEVKSVVESSVDSLKATADEFYHHMVRGEFMPNSPALMNAGRDLQQLSACFVLPVEDNMVSIFDSLKYAALIHQSGGGTGFSFSRLRPKNDMVRSTGGVASGPVSFMKVFNAATEAVKQGGVRRGANMGILRVDHPDILEFITCKTDNKELTNFNISVGITSKFMEAVEKGTSYDLVNPRNGETTGQLDAREVFELIVDQAWKNGEPGIIFLDRLNADNPTPELGEIESTNPCGEQPLLPFEACCLGSVNLGKFTKSLWGSRGTAPKDPKKAIDWDGLASAVRVGVHFLDNLIDANRYPLVEIDKMARGNRKIGLGIMGWADMLLDLKIPYNSQEALDLAAQVMEFIHKESIKASCELAEVRGVFPNYDKSVYPSQGIRVRNATTTTIAPTGTISIICGASSGIEPLFSIAFTRHVLDKKDLVEVNPRFEKAAKALGFYSDRLMEKIALHGSLEGVTDGVDGVPDEVRKVFVTAHEITPEWHIKMQAAFQKSTHNAVSKTVNFPHEATREDVKQVFLLANRLGCKGVTVYRDGSRDEQVLTVGAGTREQDGQVVSQGAGAQAFIQPEGAGPTKVNGVWGRVRPIERPSRLDGFTAAKETPVGKLFLTLNTLEGHPVELFAQIGKAGSDISAFTEAIARLVSITLRSGVDPQEVADQLLGIGGSRSIGFGPNRVRSVPDAIGQFLDEYLRTGPVESESFHEELGPVQDTLPLVPGKRFGLCPSCGTWNVVHVEGCMKCLACGYSEC